MEWGRWQGGGVECPVIIMIDNWLIFTIRGVLTTTHWDQSINMISIISDISNAIKCTRSTRVPANTTKMLIQCCFNVGPASKTVGQHWNGISEYLKRRWFNVDSTLAQRLRHWPNIESTLDLRCVFDGIDPNHCWSLCQGWFLNLFYRRCRIYSGFYF